MSKSVEQVADQIIQDAWGDLGKFDENILELYILFSYHI
jgi:hypothetical protein